jgi:hypothetical protein
METKYYFSKDGKQLGPWTMDEGLSQIQSGDLGWADYIYDEAKSDWVLLSEHPNFTMAFKSDKPGAVKAKKAAPSSVTEKDWFVLKGENKYGPFSYLEIVRLLQEKNLYEYDFVWNKELPTWTRVCDCANFTPERIKELHGSREAFVDEIFFQRRHARAKYSASVIVHNNKLLWKGQSLEVSAGGAGLLLDTTKIDPGQTIFLHFKVGDDVPPFNAVCSVVSKQILPTGKEVKYGVKFTHISRDVQEAIKTYAQKAA